MHSRNNCSQQNTQPIAQANLSNIDNIDSELAHLVSSYHAYHDKDIAAIDQPVWVVEAIGS